MTYTIKWSRECEPDLKLECKYLDPRTAFARLIRAIDNSGPILILEIVKEKENDTS